MIIVVIMLFLCAETFGQGVTALLLMSFPQTNQYGLPLDGITSEYNVYLAPGAQPLNTER